AKVLASDQYDRASLEVAIAAAGKRESTVLTGPLLTQLTNPQFGVRVAVLKAISGSKRLKEPGMVDALVDRLGDQDNLVRGFAAKVLAEAGGARAKEALSKQLAVEKNEVVRRVLEQCLARMQ
ncbi:MAG: HEAT repeat domain-containing protein, partial [Bdellovibrionales bacterium]|nr:HEAT repeat domain-containing protein [Bdellovibrionales bacterium]